MDFKQSFELGQYFGRLSARHQGRHVSVEPWGGGGETEVLITCNEELFCWIIKDLREAGFGDWGLIVTRVNENGAGTERSEEV